MSYLRKAKMETLLKVKEVVTNLYILLRSYVPRRLPVGLSEYEVWSDRIATLAGNLADKDSIRFVLASQIMHLGPQRSSVSDQFFIRSLRKGAANQVASQVFQDIKQKQQEAKAAAEKQLAEDTATLKAVSNEKVSV